MRRGCGVGWRSHRLRTGGSRRAAAAALTTVAVVAVACGSSSPSSSQATKTTTPAPAGLPSFYSEPSPLPSGPPGTLIKSQKVTASGVHGTVYRVLYLSRSVRNTTVPVTGLVIVPGTPAPPGGYPVVTWGHGTNGMTDQCAPSLQPGNAVPLVNDLLAKGWEVTASDYRGEGSPGLMPYLVGVGAARNTIDIVRAARHLGAAHASASYVTWGHSEGGQTAMFVDHIGPSYAPELHLKGVVAGAPPSQFNLIYDFLKTSPYRYYLLMAAGGFNAAYGNKAAPLPAVLTDKGIQLLPDLSKGCDSYLQKTLSNIPLSEVTKTNPFDVPAWKKLLEANDPGAFTTASPVPLLIIQGGKDEQIPVASTAILAKHLCGLGQDLQRWIYPGQSHAGVIVPSGPDMIHWMSDRFAGKANPDPYSPTGLPGIQTTSCPA